ncbi:hypothetical protein CR513_49161, partial [Mucuna pruriens]
MTKNELIKLALLPGTQMENNDRTLKELATLDMVYQPWCIQYPQLELAQTYELKSGLIHLLPKFYGLAGEDPHKHLKEFHVKHDRRSSGGALMDKTPAAARHVISNMASNTQQFGIRGPSQTQMVNEIGVASNQRLENQLIELTSLVKQIAVGQHQPAMAVKVCGICTSVEHPTDMCPTLQETESDQPQNVGAIG